MIESRTEQDSIVISGVGLTTALGLDAETTWQAVRATRVGVGRMTAMDAAVPAGTDGGQAVDLPEGFCPQLPREARYLRWTIVQALADAGVADALPYPPDRCASMLGTTLHGIRAAGRFLRSDNPDDLRDFLAGDTLRLATDGLPLHGGAATTCSACSSSLGSVALGITLLQSNSADLVVAGGYDTLSEYAWCGFNALRLVSEKPLRPFTRGRTGLKISEGYGIVILERAASVRGRGGRALVTVAGWGESADAHHLTKPHPAGEGAVRAMQQATESAGLRAGDIDLLAAHATGTPDNDAAEFAAIAEVFGDRLPDLPVVAFKSHLGHTLGGAGAVELILSAYALRDGHVPACANVRADTLEYGQLNLSMTNRPAALQHSLNTSLGFGGANTSVVLSKNSAYRPVAANTRRGRCVISGIGIVLPGVIGVDAFRERVERHRQLRANGSAVSEAFEQAGEHRSADALVGGDLFTHGGEEAASISDDDFAHLLNARRIRRMSAYVKYTLAAATLCCQDAGLDDPKTIADTVAGLLGTTHGSAEFSWEYYEQIIREGSTAANPILFAEGVPNAGAAQLSLMLGLRSACQTIIGTRTAGLDALRLAALRIETGQWQRAIVSAGEESCLTVDRAYDACGLRRAKATANRVVSDGTVDGAGFVNGPGAIGFLLESQEVAEARGANIYARLGAGATASGRRERLAETVAAVLARLPDDLPISGSACGTWVDRCERTAIDRRAATTSAAASATTGRRLLPAAVPLPELFSATPLAAMAGHLLDLDGPLGFISLCSSFGGVASGLVVERAAEDGARPRSGRVALEETESGRGEKS